MRVQKAIITDHAVSAVHRAFVVVGEDPSVIAPDFILYHLVHGKTPEQIVQIATNHVFALPRRERES